MARTGLDDGLGNEEVIIGSEAGMQVQSPFFTGSITSNYAFSGLNTFATGSSIAAKVVGTIVSGTTINGTTIVATTISGTTANVGGNLTLGSTVYLPYAQGIIINNIPCNAIISGGMWVTGSAASGTSPVVLAVAGPASAEQPLGICLANTASGANPPILTRGYYKGLIAEATLGVNDGISAGAGTALNCAAAGGAATTRGTVLMGAGSEGTIAVWLW